MTSPPANGVKRIQADWRVVLGEAAIDIRVGRFSQGLGSKSAAAWAVRAVWVCVCGGGGRRPLGCRVAPAPAAGQAELRHLLGRWPGTALRGGALCAPPSQPVAQAPPGHACARLAACVPAGHQCDVVVLGEHNLFVLSISGQITFQKRLEYHPACCTTYAVPGAKTQGGAGARGRGVCGGTWSGETARRACWQ
jgi:hypothetical protein